jgi:hypothetical protein
MGPVVFASGEMWIGKGMKPRKRSIIIMYIVLIFRK